MDFQAAHEHYEHLYISLHDTWQNGEIHNCHWLDKKKKKKKMKKKKKKKKKKTFQKSSWNVF